MAKALIELAPSALVLPQVAIGELPLYNEDLEALVFINVPRQNLTTVTSRERI